MRHIRRTKDCLDPADIAALNRDGMGWGYDLECGCGADRKNRDATGLIRRAVEKLQKGDRNGQS